MPGEVAYTESLGNSLNYDPIFQRFTERRGPASAKGTIRRLTRFARDGFSTEPSERDSAKIARIKFSLIPGYNIAEYRPEVLQLWKDVRACVTEYFKRESSL